MQSIVAHVCDHDVEMELDAERIQEEEIYRGTSAATPLIKQRMTSGGSNNERLTDVGTVPTSVSLSLLLPLTVQYLLLWQPRWLSNSFFFKHNFQLHVPVII